MDQPNPTAAAGGDGLSAGALLRAVIDAISAHPLPLLLPFVLLGALSSGGGPDAGGPGPDFDVGSGANGVDAPPLGAGEWGALLAVIGVALLLFLVVAVLLYALVWLVTTHAAFEALRGVAQPDLGAAFGAVKGDYLGAVLALLIYFLAVFVGLLALVVPGLILIAGWAPWAAVVVAEHRHGWDALSRAWELTSGHRLTLVLLVLVGFAASLAASALLGWVPFIGGLLAGAAQGVITAAAAVLGVVFYTRRVGAEPAPAAQPL